MARKTSSPTRHALDDPFEQAAPSSTGTNRAPVANNDWATLRAGTSISGHESVLLLNDTDPDGDTLRIVSYTQPAHGTLVKDAAGNITYTPAAGFSGADSFSYIVSDPAGACASATVCLTVLPAFCPPTITLVTDDVGPVQGNVPNGGNTDDTRPAITGTAEAGATVKVYDNGNLIGTTVATPAGTWTLTPATALPNGSNALTATATSPDGAQGSSAPYTIHCGPDGDNQPPIVADEYASVRSGSSIGGPESILLANDRDPEGGPLTIQSYGTPAHGTLVRDAAGNITYTPAAGYVGPDSFAYTVVDGAGKTAVGHVYLTVTPGMAPPVITTVTDDVGPSQGNVPSGGTTDDTLPVIGGTAEPGATVKVFDNGVPIGTVVATPAGTWTLPVTAPLSNGGHALTAVATAPDGASAGSAPYTVIVDTGPALGAPVVTITEDVNNDGLISRSELNNKVGVQVALPGAAKAGDTVTVSDNAGNVTGKVLSAADVTTGSVNFPDAFPPPAEGATIVVTAKLVTAGGVTSPTSTDSATLDTTAPGAPVVTLATDDNNDGQISQAELTGHANAIDVKVALPLDARPGDKLTVTDQAGRSAEKLLTPADIAAGVVNLPGAFPPAADGQPVTVTAKLSDPAGNLSPTSTDSAVMHTSAPAPTITIVDDADNNGTLTRAELAGATRVDVRVGLPAGAAAGDLLSVQDNAGNGLSKTLTAADIAAGQVQFTDAFPLPAPGATLATTAQLTDSAGNRSPVATDTAIFDANYAPIANNDTASVRASATPVAVQGNLISNDTDPDGPSSALRVAGVATGPNVVPGTGVGVLLEGTYGHLSVNADGSYQYIADKSAGLTQPVNDVFYYVDKDASGASSGVATLTVKVDPALASVIAVTPTSGSVVEGQDLLYTVTTTSTQAPTTLTLDTTGGSATPGVDTGPLQVNFGSGWQTVVGNTVTLAPNTSSFQVRVPTVDDILIEPTESLPLKVSSPDGSSATGIGSIIDNDLAGSATGTEDVPLTLTWSNFNLQNIAGAQGTLTLNSLPVDGSLQYNNGGTWLAVTTGQQFSKGDIDAGKLRFVPDYNESGINGYNAPGVGNKLNDYATFNYSASDGTGGQYQNAKMIIDIAPLADRVQDVLLMALSGGGPNIVPGHPDIYATKVAFQLSGTASPDTDGSERNRVALTNMEDYGHQTCKVLDANAVEILPDSNGIVWVDPLAIVYITSPSYNIRYNVDYQLFRQEVNSEGTVLHQISSMGKHWTYSPLVLDLNGDGVQTVSAENGVYFDLDNDGTAMKTGWSSKEDGLLVRDFNGNGRIDNGNELFGDHTTLADGSKAADGFAALGELDANHDGIVNGADAGFAQLQVWKDANTDGITQAGELHSLGSLGIIELKLAATAGTEVQNGNFMGLVSSFKTADGQSHEMVDVWFGTTGETQAATPLLAADVLGDQGGHTLDALMGGSSKPAPTVAAAAGDAAQGLQHVDMSHRSFAHAELLKPAEAIH